MTKRCLNPSNIASRSADTFSSSEPAMTTCLADHAKHHAGGNILPAAKYMFCQKFRSANIVCCGRHTKKLDGEIVGRLET